MKPVSMINGRGLVRADIEALPYGAAMLRELDLVVAVGEFEAQRTRQTLYDDVLKARVASRVAPLDEGLVPDFLGVIQADDSNGPLTQAAGERIAASPRGAWAVLRSADGRHDAWMSDGAGGVATPSGHKFAVAHSRDPSLTFDMLYGQVLGRIVYEQRCRVRHAIEEASARAALPDVGTKVARDFHLGGFSWTSLTLLGQEPAQEGFAPRWRVKLTKPGHSKTYVVSVDAMTRILGAPPVLPETWRDPANDERTLSLRERREAAAKAAWPTHAAREELDPALARYPTFHDVEDGLECALWSSADGHVGTLVVRFAPRSADVASIETTTQALRRAA